MRPATVQPLRAAGHVRALSGKYVGKQHEFQDVENIVKTMH
jgi:hypothetical protein